MTATDSPDGQEPALTGADAAREALARARAAAKRPGALNQRNAGRSARPVQPAGTRSGSGPDSRDPQELGDTVRRLLAERGWEQPAAVGGVVGRWSDIVGSEMAAHVTVEAFDPAEGRLVLRADSSAWASQVRRLTPILRGRLDTEVGAGTVRELTVLGPAAPSWRHGLLNVKGRGPRDTYG